MQDQHCLPLFAFDERSLALKDEERAELAAKVTISRPEGFAVDELAHKAPISFVDEALVMVVLLLCMGTPLLLGPVLLLCIYYLALWKGILCWLVVVIVLAFHPLPECSTGLTRSRFTAALYKYFSYRFLWSGDAKERCLKTKAWIGAGPPHGLLPFANILSIPALTAFARPFVGAAASVVQHTPGLRYLGLFGMIDVSASSIVSTLQQDICVGLVPDGIAGIFASTHDDEVVLLKSRKGIAKLALRTGSPIVPAYSIGNTEAYTAISDSFGIMQFISRKIKASLVLFFGRWGLPIPRRCNVTMLIGQPIIVTQVNEPSQLQIDTLHGQLLAELETLFDTHKAALGWGHKHIMFK